MEKYNTSSIGNEVWLHCYDVLPPDYSNYFTNSCDMGCH